LLRLEELRRRPLLELVLVQALVRLGLVMIHLGQLELALVLLGLVMDP
jgi:hypothetical protein